MSLPGALLHEAERAVQSHAAIMIYLVVTTLTNTWQPLSAGTKKLEGLSSNWLNILISHWEVIY